MRQNSLWLVVIVSGVLTLVMIQAMRGSAWPTALFLIAGFVLPYAIAKVLYLTGKRRLYRLISLVASLALLTLIAWIGKHPSAERAFRDVTGVDLPGGAQVLRVDRGWYDGRTTVVHIKADVAQVRATMQACDAAMAGQSQDARVVDEPMDKDGLPFADQWRMHTSWATFVTPWIVQPPNWAKPRYSSWLLWLKPYGGHRGVSFYWDDATGEAIVGDYEN